MKDFWSEEVEKEKEKNNKINKKKLVIALILGVILLFFIIILIIYNTSPEFHSWMDKNILNKEVMQNSATTIEIEENSKVFAYNKNIAVLNKNKLKIYNSFGSKESELDVDIANPIFNSSNRYVAIAENGGRKIYCLEDNKIIWQAEVEGTISQIHINKNGYVAVVVTGTSYKTVVAMFDNKGTALFRTYLSATRLVDLSISNDNRFLALAEVDTSGTIIQSNIKIVSVEKAQSDSTNSMEKTYNGQPNALITNIKYQDNDKLVCMYDNSIRIIADDKDELLVDYANEKINFSSIELNNSVINVKEQSSGLFTADSIVNIINVSNKDVKTYKVDSVTKDVRTYENIIALNLGSEIEFINTDGWLVKRYISKQEITNMVFSNSVAGIIYRDRVELINL